MVYSGITPQNGNVIWDHHHHHPHPHPPHPTGFASNNTLTWILLLLNVQRLSLQVYLSKSFHLSKTPLDTSANKPLRWKNPRKDPQLWTQTKKKSQHDIKDHKSFPTYFPYLSRITMDQHSGTLVPGTLLIPKSRRKNRPNHRPSDQPMGDFP